MLQPQEENGAYEAPNHHWHVPHHYILKKAIVLTGDLVDIMDIVMVGELFPNL